MKRKHRKNDIIKLGSETEASNGVYHLLRDGDRGKYAVWVQPYDTWQGKKIRSYKNWHRLQNGTLGECRRVIKEAVSSAEDRKKSSKKQPSRGRKK